MALEPPVRYSFVDSKVGLICKKKTVTNVHLRIRHGTKLLLRNIEWCISETNAECVLLARQVLQAIGCDNQAMLAAACDKHDGVINVPDALAKDALRREGTIAALIGKSNPGKLQVPGESVFHQYGGEEEDCLDESNVYIDLGDDSEEELSKSLNDSVQHAINAGMSSEGARDLREIINRNRSVFD